MELAVDAARWVVGKALGPITDGLLESWAASSELGAKIRELKMELLYAQGMLHSSGGRDVVDLCSPPLAQLLLELRQLAYSADDVMDELEYFRIQDELDGTYETTDVEALGFVQGLIINAHHMAIDVAGKLKLPSSSSCASREDTDEEEEEDSMRGALHRAVGKCLLPRCCSLPSQRDDDDDDSSKPQTKHVLMQAPKLKFNRVEISTRMTHIIEQFRPICAKVSTILGLLLPYGMAAAAPVDRPRSTSHIIDPKIYGRENRLNKVVDDVVHGKYFANDLTILPVLGVGGIGKTTFTQHVYDKVKSHFQVRIWVCVSHGFDAAMLAREILKQVPKGADEKDDHSCSDLDLIEKRLRSKRFLLVLDDVWTYHEGEWNKLLAPFRNGEAKGNVVIVTTRIPEVAQMVGTYDCLVKLERLDRDDCMLLFKACVFESEQSWESHVDLHKVAEEIVDKLKGSPLAVKTVGRLLRNQLDHQHWNVVLESKEWELQTNNDDIMPALKLSYNYLPFYLQQCFSYCGLFPEDYKFTGEELIHFWIGLGLLDSRDGNKRVEDVGLSYLNMLVNQGFFIKSEEDIGHPYYMIHDLLHELAVNVSSYECLSINSSNVRSVLIPASVHHLSVNVENTVFSDRITFEKFRKDLSALDKKLKSENLRTLMLFGEHHGSFAKIFCDLFREAKALRVIFLSGASYNVEDLFHNFSNLLHLRYLRIKDVDYFSNVSLPSCITRFYHLMVLDVQHRTFYFGCVRYMSNLVKMRHFVVGDDHRFHSDIFEVGKLKLLQELRRFEVKKETKGFELEQLGKLLQLRGSLGIYNLEKVESRREAGEAKLAEMNHLCGLTLDWGTRGPGTELITQEEDILESLKPHSNLRELCIGAHPGTTCPTWLREELSIANNLESLHLEGVAWGMLPLPGKQCTVDEHGAECPGCVAVGHGFKNLKSLELVDIPTLKKWCGDGTCDLLPRLQKLVVNDCANLIELPLFSHPRTVADKEKAVPSFPELGTVRICNCPNLSSLPPIPWSRGLCYVEVKHVGLGFYELSYSKDKQTLELNAHPDCDVWKMVDFHRLTDKVKCLETLRIYGLNRVLLPSDKVGYQFPVKNLEVHGCAASGKELTELLSHFPSLSRLRMYSCYKVTGLGVVAPPEGGEMDDAGGLLLLPPEIEELVFMFCGGLVLHPSSLQGLRRLRSLHAERCGEFLPSGPSSSACHYFPCSLQQLTLSNMKGTLTLLPIPNLTSLYVYDCADLTCEGVWPLLTQLYVTGSPKFFNCGPGQQDLPHSSRLETLCTDNFAGALTKPICRHLSSSLANLILMNDPISRERFTVAQEEALQMLVSLRQLKIISLRKLRCLPATRSLASLETLCLVGCEALRSVVPKDGGLPASLKVLSIADCPAIRSLPKDGIPDSLRELDVQSGNSRQLRRRCRRLKGTIPIVRT